MSATLRDPLKCGECGSDRFRLVNVRGPDDHRAGGGGTTLAVHRGENAERAGGSPGVVAGYIVAVCEQGHESVVSVSVPSVTIAGTLCGGW